MIKKSLLLVALALLPLFALAQWQPVRGQTTSSASTNQSYDNWWSRRFTVGLTFTGDFYKYAGGVGAGLLFNFGRDTDLLNVSFGAEYIEYLASDPRPEELKSKLNIIDAGGQLVVPVMAKLLFLRTSEWSKVYIGCGAEWGFRMRDGSSLADYYPEGPCWAAEATTSILASTTSIISTNPSILRSMARKTWAKPTSASAAI